MPVIRHECPAEEVRGSAMNSRATRTPCPGTHVPTSVCPIWHATRLLSLAVGLADAAPSREPTVLRAGCDGGGRSGSQVDG
jgi:hypothetical protein